MMSFKLFCILFLGVVATSMAASVSTEEASESNEVERGFSKDSKGNDRCTCDNVSCQCCVTPKIPKVGSLPGCLRIQINANQKSIGLILHVKGKQVINSQFHIGAKDEKCAHVPGTWNTIKGCVDTDTSNLPNNAGLQTCAKIAIKGVGAPIASLIFPCVQMANGRVSFNDRGEVKARNGVKVKFF